MNWKKLIGTVAPILGGTLGGPFGVMAGKFIAEGLGVEESELKDTMANASPDTMLKLKELDVDFESKMADIGLSTEQLHVQDRSSARMLAEKTSILPQALLSVIFIAGFIMTLYTVFSGNVKLDGPMKDAAMFLLGILSSGILQIMNFWFGSSSGSKEKTTKINKELDKT